MQWPYDTPPSVPPPTPPGPPPPPPSRERPPVKVELTIVSGGSPRGNRSRKRSKPRRGR